MEGRSGKESSLERYRKVPIVSTSRYYLAVLRTFTRTSILLPKTRKERTHHISVVWAGDGKRTSRRFFPCNQVDNFSDDHVSIYSWSFASMFHQISTPYPSNCSCLTPPIHRDSLSHSATKCHRLLFLACSCHIPQSLLTTTKSTQLAQNLPV